MKHSSLIAPLGTIAFMGLAFAGTGSSDGADIMFDRLDANDDGRITQQEAKANDTVAEHFDQLDADGNGELTPVELREATSSGASG